MDDQEEARIPARSADSDDAGDRPAPGRSGVSSARSRVWGAAPLTAWAFAFVLLRIFAVSGYDWDTAFNVSTTLNISDGLNLIFGSLMGGHVLVEILLAILLPLLVADFLWSPWGRRPLVVLPGVVGAVILVAITVSYRNWWLLAAAAAVFGVFAVLHALPDGFPLRRALMLAMRRVGLVSGVGVLIAAAFITVPWVPEEHLQTTDGPLDAYVLSIDSGYLNLLTTDHEFLILQRDEVLSRE